MRTKLIEIRDEGTAITALAIRLDAGTEQERYLLARAGYGESRAQQQGYVLLLNLNGGAGEFQSDPYQWDRRRGRTLFEAQRFINAHFDTLEAGQVVDVEYLLGETAQAKPPERLLHHVDDTS